MNENKLIRDNIKMVYKLANKYAGKLPMLEYQDIFQEVQIALLEAGRKLDSGRGKLSTLTYLLAHKRVFRFYYYHSSTIRIPEGAQTGKNKSKAPKFYFDSLDLPVTEGITLGDTLANNVNTELGDDEFNYLLMMV